jgi:dienelactone hydrolase
MKRLLVFALVATSIMSCNNDDKTTTTATGKTAAIVEQDVPYSVDTVNMNGFAAYDSSNKDKRPVVLVVHEWWGLNDYTKSRVRQLAELGYLAMAVDLYGDRKQGNDPAAAGALAMPFYTNPQMAQQRFDAALAKVKTFAQADTSKIAAIGYCFGGAQVLNMARLGEPLVAVVSFHGNLVGVAPKKELMKAQILVCHGAADGFVPPAEVAQFKKQMDSVGISYEFHQYDSAKHAFTNPGATALGEKFGIPVAYNAAADSASWNDMKAFFKKIF